MSNYVLVGAGGFGRELRKWCQTYSPQDKFIGYVDDVSKDKDVLGGIDDHIAMDAEYIIAMGDGNNRLAVAQRLAEKNIKLRTIISPYVMQAEKIISGSGSIFLGACSISSNVSIGKLVLVQGFACVGHDVCLEDGVTLGSHVFLGGGCFIGRGTTIHPHACILPNVRIGENVTVGAGSVVTKDIPDSVTIFGSPAKIIVYK